MSQSSKNDSAQLNHTTQPNSVSLNGRERVRVAVVGFGVMGKHHANIYAALPYVDLVAVVEPDANQRDMAQFQHEVRAYASLDAMLATEELDAVSIAAPTGLHYDLSKACLEAGIHVMVEKPVTTDVHEAEALIELSRTHRLIFQVGHITRFYRAVKLLNERVQRPYLIEARRLSPSARIQDVGVILDLMIHDIDIVLGLVDSPVADMMISGHVLASNPVVLNNHEDIAAAQITFENGCIARFLASRIAPDAERTLVVAEADKTFRIDFSKEPHTEVAIYRAPKGSSTSSEVHMERTNVHDDNPLKDELEHFLDRIRYSVIPIGTLEDDLRSLRLATRLLDELHQNLQTRPEHVQASFSHLP
jgi:predicted dehydrogenase